MFSKAPCSTQTLITHVFQRSSLDIEHQSPMCSRAPHSTLMLGCSGTIHLGIQWPSIRCSRAYAQHQHGRLQGLCTTHPIIFSCVPELLAQHKGMYSCAPDILAQHNSAITQVFHRSTLNTRNLVNHVLQGPRPTQTSIYIYHQ